MRDHRRERHVADHLQQNKRQTLGQYYQLYLPMKTSDVELFRRTMRMSPESFDELTELVKPYTQRNETVSAEECLAITIRYLATGNIPEDVALSFRVEESTIVPIVRQTCNIIGSHPISKIGEISFEKKTVFTKSIKLIVHRKHLIKNLD